MMLTLRARIGSGAGLAVGPEVGAVHALDEDRAAAGPLADATDRHPAADADHLPLPPAVRRPKPALGRIVWPAWGLTRYAVGHLLMGPADLAALEAVPGWDGRVSVSILSEADAEPVTLAMRVCARRPLSDPREYEIGAITPADGRRVPWVVTLVDDRFDRSGILYQGTGPAAPASWGELIAELGTAAGYSFSAGAVDAMVPAFPVPASEWWGRERLSGRPAVVLLDAAAAAVCLRIVVADDGTATVQDAATADTSLAVWWGRYGPKAGQGGRYDADVERPDTVAFAFDQGGATAEAMPNGVRGKLSVFLQPEADGSAYAAAYLAAMDAWYAIDPPSAEFNGHVPSGVAFGVFVHDPGRGISASVRDPLGYPWPLAGTPTTPEEDARGYVPTCETTGEVTDAYPVWFTNYLHLSAVAVSVGESLAPGQLVGYIAVHQGGAHLHFALGDGKPLVQPGYVVPIAGKTVQVTGWLGYPIGNPRTGCARGSMGAAEFDAAELAFIESRFASPVRSGEWRSFLGSPFHCDYDYHAVDLAWAPILDQVEAGQPVYAATTGGDILTTVEAVSHHPVVGFAVLLRHSRACTTDPGEESDPHDIMFWNQYPGNTWITINNPPPGTVRPHQPGSFEPVTRVCLGKLPPMSVVGNILPSDTPPGYVSLDPAQFEVVNNYLRIKPALLANPTAFTADPPGEAGLLPVTIERTKVTVPAGMLIAETVCSPPATTCCDGPQVPCEGFDPILPVSVTGPFCADCAETTLTGLLAWDNGNWRYEGFVQGECGGAGFLANVQLQKVGADWVLSIQFTGVGDDLLTEFSFAVTPVGDGSVLAGTGTVERPDCAGELTAEVGNPCHGGGGGGGGDGTIATDCCGNLLPATLSASISGGALGTFPLTYNAGLGRWESGVILPTGCGKPGFLNLVCGDGAWVLSTGASGGVPADAAACAPLALTFTVPIFADGLCSGPVVIEVSAT